MSIQEKRSLFTLIGSLLITVVYFLYIFNVYDDGTHTADDLSYWSKVVLVLIPVQIVLMIVMHILFYIFLSIAQGKEAEPYVEDERDKLIELKSGRNAHYVFMIGVLLGMGALALEYPPASLFIVIIGSGVLSEIVSTGSKLYYYRRGV